MWKIIKPAMKNKKSRSLYHWVVTLPELCLEDAAVAIFKDFFRIEKGHMPQRRIITNLHAVYNGMASMMTNKKPEINSHGMKIKNKIMKIHLKSTLFEKDMFYSALSTYIHELCHSFGGDASQAFSLALTVAIEILMEHHDKIETYKKQWETLFKQVLEEE